MPADQLRCGGFALGVMVDRALVVVLLVGEFGLREHVLVVDDEQQVVVRLQVQRPGVGRRGDMLHDTSGLAGSRTSMTEKPLEKMWPI